MKKTIPTTIPTFYVTASALTTGFSDEGKQINSVDFWVLGDKRQFNDVIMQTPSLRSVRWQFATLYVVAITVGYKCYHLIIYISQRS